MDAEKWKTIPGFQRYEVSDRGRVRSLVGHWGKRDKPKDLSPCLTAGYPSVGLVPNGGGGKRAKTMYVHRLVLMAFVGMPSGGDQCCHRDGNRSNNSLSNLEWNSGEENNRQKQEHREEDVRQRKALDNLLEARRLVGAGVGLRLAAKMLRVPADDLVALLM